MKRYAGKRFFIYGDGLSGRAAKAAVTSNGGRAAIYSDINGRFVCPPERAYDGGIISPGIRPDHPVYEYCRSRGIRTLSEADIGFELCGGDTFIGITGTNGKTTVTRLVASMTGGVACGNVGYPVSTAVLNGGSPVCELSSFQLYTARLSPRVAVITNITADHLDWHGSYSRYCECKCNIAKYMTSDGYLILGDVTVGALSSLETDARVLTVGTGDCAYVDGGYFCFAGSRVCAADYFRLNGEHNIKNALCAIAAAKCVGADNANILEALSTASLDPHRVERVGEAAGKLWIDDSKGTNIAACLAAVAQTSGSVCLIAGGRSKGGNFISLFDSLDDRVIEVVAMGEAAQQLRDDAVRCGCKAKLTVVDGLKDAVRAARRGSARTVLLSPACASFDEFKDYAARGDAFKAAVRAIEGNK